MVALHQVRAVALTGYQEVARSVGLDPVQMLERHGIEPALLADPEHRLPATEVAHLLQESADESGEDDFALLLACQRTYESFGPVTELHRNVRSIRGVVDATLRGRRLVSDVFVLQIQDGDEGDILTVGVLPQFASVQSIILTTALTYLMLHGASRGHWKFQSVNFRHSAPSDTARFERFFGAPVHFSRPFDGFTGDQGSLDRPWPVGNDMEVIAGLVASLEWRIAELKRHSGTNGALISSLEDALVEVRLATNLGND